MQCRSKRISRFKRLVVTNQICIQTTFVNDFFSYLTVGDPLEGPGGGRGGGGLCGLSVKTNTYYS
jgi:hypothetical protein